MRRSAACPAQPSAGASRERARLPTRPEAKGGRDCACPVAAATGAELRTRGRTGAGGGASRSAVTKGAQADQYILTPGAPRDGVRAEISESNEGTVSSNMDQAAEGPNDLRLLLAVNDASSTASLASWLRRNGAQTASLVPEGAMGASELLAVSVLGSAGARALATIAQEWIRAHRTSISARIEGRASVTLEGPTDIAEFVRLLEQAPLEASGD